MSIKKTLFGLALALASAKATNPCNLYNAFASECTNASEEFQGFEGGEFSSTACQVLVNTRYQTCSQYCQSQNNAQCVAAQDNVLNGCEIDSRHNRQTETNQGCDQQWNNQICVCDNQNTVPPSEPINACEDYNGYHEQCSNLGSQFHQSITSYVDGNDNCQVQVYTYGGTCADYCEDQGAVCVAGQDNYGATCSLDPNHHRQDTENNGCNQSWNNQICVCNKSGNIDITMNPGVSDSYVCLGMDGTFNTVCQNSDFTTFQLTEPVNSCQVQADTNNETCNTFCQGQQMICVGGQNNIGDTCDLVTAEPATRQGKLQRDDKWADEDDDGDRSTQFLSMPGNFQRLEMFAESGNKNSNFVVKYIQMTSYTCGDENSSGTTYILGNSDNARLITKDVWGQPQDDTEILLFGGVPQAQYGRIYATNAQSDELGIVMNRKHWGLGVQGRSAEIDSINGEKLVLEINEDNDAGLCFRDAIVGFDSMLGHFIEGSTQDASVVVAAFNNENETRDSVQVRRGDDTDGDNNPVTSQTPFIEGQWDQLEFWLTQEGDNADNLYSNFVVSFITVHNAIGGSVTIGLNANEISDWGVFDNDSGIISFDQQGVRGTIYAYDPITNSPKRVAWNQKHSALGVEGRSTEIGANDEVLVIEFADNTYTDITVGFDSLYGHFKDRSRWDAHVNWKAIRNGVGEPDNENGCDTNLASQVCLCAYPAPPTSIP